MSGRVSRSRAYPRVRTLLGLARLQAGLTQNALSAECGVSARLIREAEVIGLASHSQLWCVITLASALRVRPSDLVPVLGIVPPRSWVQGVGMLTPEQRAELAARLEEIKNGFDLVDGVRDEQTK